MSKNSVDLLSASLIDPDDIFDEEKVKARNAQAVHDAVVSGASVEDLLEAFNYNHLKDALSYYNVRGRSNLTYMKDMAVVLVRVLGDGLSKQRAGTKRDVEYINMKDKEKEYQDEIFQLKQKITKLEKDVKELKSKNKKLKQFKSKYKKLKKTLS